MKYLISFFTSNWGLKILALILALVVFYSMKDSSRDTTYNETSPAFNLRGTADGGN